MSNALSGLEGKRSPPNMGCMYGGGNELNVSTPVVGNRTECLLKNGVRSDCRTQIDASVEDSKRNMLKAEKANEHSH